MVMPLRDLRAIYELLFRDGVMVAKKDKRPQTKHPEIPGVANLQVIRAMGSLKSRGYVKETFAWRHFYWYLTNEGIVYLRDHLHLPPEIMPASLQRVRRPAATLRQGYRHKRMDAGEETYSDTTPRFRGRPLIAEPVRPKASWELEDQHQPPLRKGRGFRSE
uniref:Plectin/eS10 N-terminal domain-containing protein n=1 Tax=Myripristis murdjan TaxID=586833 RepID=A0A668A5R8_9TELE